MSKSKISIISIISLFIILLLSVVIYFQNRIKNIENNISKSSG